MTESVLRSRLEFSGEIDMPHNRMANFVETQNIARYKALLETEQHPDKRQILIQLLADGEAKHEARIAATREI